MRISSKIMNAISRIRKKLWCPLLLGMIEITLIYIIFFNRFSLHPYDVDNSFSNIKAKIESSIDECGKDYWISWLVLDTRESKDKYRFKDVVGCSPSKKINCAFSVKDTKLNPFYNQKYHRLDSKTYDFLMKLEMGTAAYFRDMSFFEDYPTIKEILEKTNKPIEELSMSITRNFTGDIVYVFTMTSTSKKVTACKREKMINILEDLSLYAKQTLYQ